MPLDVDLPGPPTGMRGSGTVNVRLTLHTSRGDLTVTQPLMLKEEGALDQEEPRQGLLAQFRTSVEAVANEVQRYAEVGREQYEALLRSVERRYEPDVDPGVSGFHARLPHRPLEPSDNAEAIYKRVPN